MRKSTSLRRRVAIVVGTGAAVAATIAAVIACAIAAVALRTVEDRRLHDAAVILADEVDSDLVVVTDHAALTKIVADEAVEMQHTGIAFALDVEGHAAGDPRLQTQGDVGCYDIAALRLRQCRVVSDRGFVVVAADAHTDPLWLFVLAACAAALSAGLLGVVVSRPLANLVVAPLSRLQQRVAAIDIDGEGPADLGADEDVVEVDDVRAATAALVQRTRASLAQARRFAADAAHELRTPLATLRAELELLEEGVKRSVHHADVVRVRSMSERLQLLVERLLILATPQGFSATETVAVKDLIEDVVAALPAADRARIDVAGDDSVCVGGDSVLLATLIGNGLSNALKFAHHAKVDVRRRDGRCVITVLDDGPGIASALRTQVFEPLFRTDDARARRIAGHGLGLALVAHIARLHDGEARFVDENGGACLQIDLPSLT